MRAMDSTSCSTLVPPADPKFFRECALHINGNFTLQNLIEVLGRVRALLASKPLQTQQQFLAIEKFKRAFRGLDPYGESGCAIELPQVELLQVIARPI